MLHGHDEGWWVDECENGPKVHKVDLDVARRAGGAFVYRQSVPTCEIAGGTFERGRYAQNHAHYTPTPQR